MSIFNQLDETKISSKNTDGATNCQDESSFVIVAKNEKRKDGWKDKCNGLTTEGTRWLGQMIRSVHVNELIPYQLQVDDANFAYLFPWRNRLNLARHQTKEQPEPRITWYSKVLLSTTHDSPASVDDLALVASTVFEQYWCFVFYYERPVSVLVVVGVMLSQQPLIVAIAPSSVLLPLPVTRWLFLDTPTNTMDR